MRLSLSAVGFLFALSITGCGSSSGLTTNPGPPPPHGGEIVYMNGDQGIVEVVKKNVSSPKESVDAEVSFYFYKDAFTPITPPPTSGSLIVTKKKIALKPSGDALVTPSGPALFARSDLDGSLTVEIDGKPVAIRLGVR